MQGYQTPQGEDESVDVVLASPKAAMYDTDEDTAQKNTLSQMKQSMEYFLKKVKIYTGLVATSEEQATEIM